MVTVVFDLDGTLADTSGDLLAAANTVFRGWGLGDVLDHGRADDRATAVRGSRAMLKAGLERVHGAADAGQIEDGYPLLIDAYGAAIAEHTVLYPGAVAAVERLRAAGHGVSICTNKPEGLAETLLQTLNIRDLFGALVGADTLPVRKPDPSPLQEAVSLVGGTMDASVLIGDTVTDRDCARNAGIPCVLVTFGPAGLSVADLAPEALLDHFDGLEDCLARLTLL